jgi:hypothetical protein
MNIAPTTLFETADYQITYDPAGYWLTLSQGDFEAPVLIGPDGLIDAGLNLCEFPNPEAAREWDIYSHPDGVIEINLEPSTDSEGTVDLTFTAGNRYWTVKLTSEMTAALGLALIRHGHKLNLDNAMQRRFGGGDTFKEVTP